MTVCCHRPDALIAEISGFSEKEMSDRATWGWFRSCLVARTHKKGTEAHSKLELFALFPVNCHDTRTGGGTLKGTRYTLESFRIHSLRLIVPDTRMGIGVYAPISSLEGAGRWGAGTVPDKGEYCQFDFDKSSTESATASPPFSWQILITSNYVIVPTGDESVTDGEGRTDGQKGCWRRKGVGGCDLLLERGVELTYCVSIFCYRQSHSMLLSQ